MKRTSTLFLLIPFLLLLASCGGKSGDTEAATEEYAEEEAYEEYYEYGYGYGGGEGDGGGYEYADLECWDANGNINLGNVYQFYPAEAAEIEAGDGYEYSILDQQYGLLSRFRKCKNIDDWEDWSPLEDYIGVKVRDNSAASTSRKREDLMPMIEDEFFNVNPEFVRRASNLLVPAPGKRQYNGLLYQQIYDTQLKDENRKLYVAYFVLKNLSLLEFELRNYAAEGHRYEIREDETVFERGYPDVNSLLYSRYAYQEVWGEFLDLDYASNIETYVAFWLRRIMDGSADELVKAQERILASYDRDWYNEFRNEKTKGLPTIEDNISDERYDELYERAEENVFMVNVQGMQENEYENIVVEETVITVTLNNGEVLTFEDDTDVEYEEEGTYFYAEGFVPGHQAVIISRGEYEWSQSIWVSLKTGEQVDLSEFGNAPSVSPGGNYMVQEYYGMEYNGVKFYDLSSGTPEYMFSSPFLTGENNMWIDDHTYLVHPGDSEVKGVVVLPEKEAFMEFEEVINQDY
ncbi:MAG TPA: hypothetical protein DCE41_11190 [Cytophagales bacterium]|nr:hypothetical protein [Cytophagales bacterium]HAA20595.1 hypothetical protein [Cytophagales bacterium]HAP61095.1 hypothetical protein [Cytophagales bacterium]